MPQKIFSSVKSLGFLQALAVAGYCSLVGILFWKGNKIFGTTPNYFGPVAVLLLFSVSAMICGSIVFYKPYRLFFEGKKKDAAELVLITTGWLFAFFILYILLAVILP